MSISITRKFGIAAVQARAVLAEEEDVGLEPAEAALADLRGQPGEIVEGLDRRAAA